MFSAATGGGGPTWAQVAARRLQRQRLLGEPSATAHDAATAMGAAHAQVMTAAEVSIGLRSAGLTRTDVRRAVWAGRTLVKTFGPRGTVHLVPAESLMAWMGALAAIPRRSGLPAGAQLDPGQEDDVVAAIGRSLSGAPLTMAELSEAVVADAGPWAGELVVPGFTEWWPRWRSALDLAAHRGVLCFGPERGRKVTFTSPSGWVGDAAPIAPDVAFGWLVHEYLHAFGPASPAHLARWLAAPPRWVADQLERRGDLVEQILVEDEPALVAAGDTTFPDPQPHHVRLLPYFDAYSVGAHPRRVVFPGAASDRALKKGQAGTMPVLLVGGAVAGVWHSRRRGTSMQVTVEPFRRLSRAQRGAVEHDVERIAEVGEASAELTWGTVEVGHHL